MWVYTKDGCRRHPSKGKHMTKDEALRMALEALEYPGPSWIEARQPAITAIREVLAQPEQERTWQGLTDEEKNAITWGNDIYKILELAEAKLKEKNT